MRKIVFATFLLVIFTLTTTAAYAMSNCDSGLAMFAMFCKDRVASLTYVIPFGSGSTVNANFTQLSAFSYEERDYILVIAENGDQNEILLGLGNSSIQNYESMGFDRVTYWYNPKLDLPSADQLVMQMAGEVKNLNPEVQVKVKIFDHDMP